MLKEVSDPLNFEDFKDVRVTGRVTSAETGDGLAGVSVFVKGSTLALQQMLPATLPSLYQIMQRWRLVM